MHPTLRVAAGLLALVVSAVPALAQRTTGSIIGTVSDDTGAVLPGVTVELTGESVVGTQTSVTNERGFYRFPALPPGDYDLAYRMSGFATMRSRNVPVGVGSTVEQNVSMQLSTLEEEVIVTSEAPVVDTASSKIGTNYDKDWVRNAPIPRFTFFDYLNAAPGVNASNSQDQNRSNVLGSSVDENLYQMDGTDFTSPFTGAAWPWPNTDAIEEIEVLSLGASAEYGNVSGAVFNVVTRQGSNEFHGDVNAYIQTDGLTSSNTSAAEDDGFPFHREKFHDFTAQLSGPIVEDKLWFLASFQYQRDHQAPHGVDPRFFTENDNDRYFGKLNWQISSNHKIMAALHNDVYTLPYTPTALTAPSTIGAEHGTNPTPNITYTGILSDKTYVEARASGFFGRDHHDPVIEGQPRIMPRFYNLDTGEITGGTYWWYDNDVFKQGVSAKISHFADEFLGGSHDFKFGVQWSRGGNDGIIGYNDFIYTYEYYGYQYAYGYAYQPTTYGGTANALGVFVDDTWRIGERLTVNLGVRYDRNRASVPERIAVDPGQEEAVAGGAEPTGDVLAPIDNLYTWNVVSPRVGFNLKLTEDGRTVFKGHYGRYYRQLISGEFSNNIGLSPSDILFGFYDLEAGAFIDPGVFSSSTNLGVDPDYKNPYTDQFIVAFERELAPNLAFSLNYTHKRGRDYPVWRDVTGQYEDTTYVDDVGVEATGARIGVRRLLSDPGDRFFEMTNNPEMESTVNAVTGQFTKRMADSWQLTAAVTWLRATGLIPQSNQGPAFRQESSLVFSDFGQNPNDLVNAGGRLPAERPLSVKTQFVWEAPAGFLVGVNYNHQSGRAWVRTVRVPDLGIPTTINAVERSRDRALPSWNVFDLRLQKRFSLSESVSFDLFADALNLFNDGSHEDLLSTLGTSESFGVPSQFLLPRRIMLGARFRF